MSKLGTEIQGILRTDLFRLQPAGYTPLRALSYTNQNEPKFQRLPSDEPKDESGEVHLISDRSLIVLNGTEVAPLYSLYADQALKQHIIGRRLDRLPFMVRHTLPASWQASLEIFSENYKHMRANLRAKKYDLEKHGLVDLVYEDAAFSTRYDQVVHIWQSICVFLSRYLRERGDDELKSYVSRMDKAQRSLYLNVPPMRFAYLPEHRRAADALMYVKSSEEGAELFLGWQRETTVGMRMNLLDEREVSARNFMNATKARAGVAYAVPPMFPYGMTGGVEALVIQPRLESYLLDDWGRSLPGDWWKQYVGRRCKEIDDEQRGRGADDFQASAATRKKAVELLNRLYEECVIPSESLGIGSGKDGIYRRRIKGEAPLNAFVFNDFVARFVRVRKGSDTFNVKDYADLTMAWVVLGGALSVTSPSGIRLDMKEGDACLFPASVSGEFQVDVMEEPTRYVAISSPVSAGLAPSDWSLLL